MKPEAWKWLWLLPAVFALGVMALVFRGTAVADHLDPHSYLSGTWIACSDPPGNCQHYDFTLTMKKYGMYCRWFILKSTNPTAGYHRSYFNNDPTKLTWSYQICRSNSPKSVAYDVETDGGPTKVLVHLHHDRNGNGVQDADDDAFDYVEVCTDACP